MGGLFSTEPDTITRRESVPTLRPASYSGSSSRPTSSSSAKITTDWRFVASSQPRTVSNRPKISSSSSSTRVSSDLGFLASSRPKTVSDRPKISSSSSSTRLTSDLGFLASSQPRTVSNRPKISSSSSSTRLTSDLGFLASSEPKTASNRSTSDLKRVYGYFQCSNCRKLWQSSHVYCKAGTSKVEYGQECKACKVMCKPYRIENLVCSGCAQEDCICKDKNKRHNDPAKHHRKDLCAKCRAGRPCV